MSRTGSSLGFVAALAAALPGSAWAQPGTQPPPLAAPVGPADSPAPPFAPAPPPASVAPVAPISAAPVAVPAEPLAAAPEGRPSTPAFDEDTSLPPSEAVADDGLSAQGTVEGDEDDLGYRPRPRLQLSSMNGAIGLLRTSTGETGEVGDLRIALRGEFASTNSLVIRGDQNRRLAGGLGFGFTPWKPLEIFGAVLGGSNRNRRICGPSGCVSESDRVDPEIIRTFGDLLVGSKFAAPVTDALSLGAEVGLRFFASNSGIAFEPSATSVWFGALGTYDLRAAADLPLRAHLNAGFFVDNSSKLQDFTGVSRGSRAVSSFAYGMGKNRFRSSVAFDAPMERLGGSDVSLLPFLEYHLEYVTGAADPSYRDFMPPVCRGSSPTSRMDAPVCSDNRDQQWLTFGLRAQLGNGAAVDLGADVGLRAPGFPYGPPVLPFNFIFGFLYPFDLAGNGAPPRIVTRTVTVEKVVEKASAPKEGFIAGKVTGAKGEPVAGAVIGVKGQPRSRVATDPDGAFATKALPPGPVELEILAPSFQPAVVQANVLVGQTAEIAAALKPRDLRSKIIGRVVDDMGQPVGAMIRFEGPEKAEVTTDDAGSFSVTLPAGAYTAFAEAPRFATGQVAVALSEGTDRTLEVKLLRSSGAGPMKAASAPRAVAVAPAAPGLVSVRGDRLVVARPVAFKLVGDAPTADLAPGVPAVLDQVAQFLTRNPGLSVRVETHWDGSMDRAAADAITQQQAETIAALLGRKGLGPDRVQAAGMGARKPVVPNIGPSARAKNRRVEFHVVK